MIVKYNTDKLLDMAADYLEAENEYRRHRLTYKGGWIPSLDPSTYGHHVYLETKSLEKLYALRDACEMVGADRDTVIATAKSMRRFEERNRWQICARPGWGAVDNLRRFLSEA